MPVNISGLTGVTTPGLASDTMPTSGGDAVVESGSNTDGDWTRWADGTQSIIKHNKIVDVLVSVGSMKGQWLFPSSFINKLSYAAVASYRTRFNSDEPNVFANGSVGVSTEAAGGIGLGRYSSSSISISCHWIAGSSGAGFAAGDKMYVSIMATGRWK